MNTINKIKQEFTVTDENGNIQKHIVVRGQDLKDKRILGLALLFEQDKGDRLYILDSESIKFILEDYIDKL